MPDVTYVKLQTQTEKTFQLFLCGKYLPPSSCEHIMRELSDGKPFDDYNLIVSVIKYRLRAENVTVKKGVMFVEFDYMKKEQERPVLIRVLNMIYGESNFIVVNMSEVVYIPAGHKNNSSLNELSEWLTEVAEEHVHCKGKKPFIENLKSLFKPTATKEVNLSFV